MLCSYTSQCVNPDDAPECNLRPSPPLKYEMKYTFDVSVEDPGYRYHDVQGIEKYVVNPGDIIGFETDGNSVVWCRNASSVEVADGIVDKSSEGGPLGVRHFLRAVLTEATNMSLPYMYNDVSSTFYFY